MGRLRRDRKTQRCPRQLMGRVIDWHYLPMAKNCPTHTVYAPPHVPAGSWRLHVAHRFGVPPDRLTAVAPASLDTAAT